MAAGAVGRGAGVVVSEVGLAWGAAVTVVLIAANTAAKLYRRRLSLSWGRDTPRGLAAAACALGLLVAAAEVVRADGPTLVAIVRCVGLAVLLLGSLRLLVLLVARWGRLRGMRERVLVVGTGPVAVDLVRTMREHPQYGLEPVGFVDRTPTASPAELPLPVVGSDLAQAVDETGASSIMLAFSKVLREAQVIDAAITAHETGTEIYAVPRLFEMYHDGTDVERVRSYPLVRLTVLPTRRPSWKLKRVLDFVAAGVGLVVAAPVMAAVAAAVLLERGRPLLFRQSRIGKDGQPFDVLKFRSMRPSTRPSRRPAGPSRTTRASARWAGCCAARRWTSSPSCGTSSAAT